MPDLSDIVRVTATISPQSALQREFGRTLFLYPAHDSPLLSEVMGRRARDVRVNVYNSLDSLDNDFGTDEEAYRAGNIYFQQVPFPRDFMTAGWFENGASGWIIGSDTDTLANIMALGGTKRLTGGTGVDLSAITALTSTSVTVDGVSVSVDFSSQTSGSDIASTLQTALNGNAAFDSITVMYVNTRFVVTAPAGHRMSVFSGAAADELGLDAASAVYDPGTSFRISGQEIPVELVVQGTGATAFSAIATNLQNAIAAAIPSLSSIVVTYSSADTRFTVTAPIGTDLNGLWTGAVADALGMSADEGATYFPGVPAETVSEALTRIAGADDSWYWLTVDSSIAENADQALPVAAWVNARTVQLVMDSIGLGVLSQNETTSVAAQLFALGYDRVNLIWSRTSDYKSVSYAARFSSVNFNQDNSLITGKFKSLPGTKPDMVSDTEKEELDRKRVNHYSPYAGVNMVAEGYTLNSAVWTDVRYWLDWLVSTVQTELFSLLSSSRTRVPQTSDGLRQIQNTVDEVMERGVRNGGSAPGQLSESVANDIRVATNNRFFDGFLSTGYLVYVRPFTDQSQVSRAARTSPPVNVWAKGSGAVHEIDISILFED